MTNAQTAEAITEAMDDQKTASMMSPSELREHHAKRDTRYQCRQCGLIMGGMDVYGTGHHRNDFGVECGPVDLRPESDHRAELAAIRKEQEAEAEIFKLAKELNRKLMVARLREETLVACMRLMLSTEGDIKGRALAEFLVKGE